MAGWTRRENGYYFARQTTNNLSMKVIDLITQYNCLLHYVSEKTAYPKLVPLIRRCPWTVSYKTVCAAIFYRYSIIVHQAQQNNFSTRILLTDI